jgi:hypothetical protein
VRSGWAAEAPPSREIAPLLMGGVDHDSSRSVAPAAKV